MSEAEYFAYFLPVFFGGVAFAIVTGLMAQMIFGMMRTIRETFGLGERI